MFREFLAGIEDLQFNLIYHGPLPSVQGDTTRARDKQRIRREFIPQLRTLWETSRNIQRLMEQGMAEAHMINRGLQPLDQEEWTNKTNMDPPNAIMFWRMGGFRFLPLVTRYYGVRASVAVDFLRQGSPGDLIIGGDLDNRMKVLLDALRMPRDLGELCGDQPREQDEMFWTVLEDDSLITSFSVESSQLLAPILPHSKVTDVWLRIRVTIHPVENNLMNLMLT